MRETNVQCARPMCNALHLRRYSLAKEHKHVANTKHNNLNLMQPHTWAAQGTAARASRGRRRVVISSRLHSTCVSEGGRRGGQQAGSVHEILITVA